MRNGKLSVTHTHADQLFYDQTLLPEPETMTSLLEIYAKRDFIIRQVACDSVSLNSVFDFKIST